MDLEEIISASLKDLLDHLDIKYTKLEISKEDDKDTYILDIKSDDQNLLIGYHGQNLQAIQQVLKTMVVKQTKDNTAFHIVLDIDGYRKRQEENAINLADRKISILRRTRRPQSLPAQPAYFRRKIHLHLMGSGYEDIETNSIGEGEDRHIVLKLKS
ncbi:MAG: KH domain-containing protein [Candidatus Woesearchaeota archaeon]|jgi:spoIIIJ-associated protein